MAAIELFAFAFESGILNYPYISQKRNIGSHLAGESPGMAVLTFD